jgi:hypothetical protein
MAIFNPHFTTRRWLKVGLTVAGCAAGAAMGLMMTRFGKIAAGAPPATLGNYAWNAAIFGIIGGVFGPFITWSNLRNVPLWRTIVEPLGLAFAGASLSIMVGVPALFLLLAPAGLAVGIVHLQRRFPDRTELPELDAHGPSLHAPAETSLLDRE